VHLGLAVHELDRTQTLDQDSVMIVRNIKYLIAVLLLSAFCQSVFAVAPANTDIKAAATLTYTGLSAPIVVSVNVKVILKTASPNIDVPVTVTVAEQQPSQITLLFTANANGEDAYPLASFSTPTDVTNNQPAVFLVDAIITNSVSLGATAAFAQASAGATSILVPYDGTAGSSVNGLLGGDKVVINGAEYDIASVVDNGNGNDKTINFSQPLAVMVPFGTLIAERREVVLRIPTVGNLTTAAPGSIQTRVTVTNSGSESIDVLHTTNVVAVNFKKFVRNVTTPNGDVADAATINGEVYFTDETDTVLATRGDVLEYAIRVIAPLGTSLSDVRVSDPVPIFTLYNANSSRLNTITVNADGIASPLIAPGMLIDDDTGRTAEAIATGTIGAGNTAVVTFRVTVE
tara:strand:+ start:2560 stop:3768 length:1209 start_codon:yes stop_codon:yes gene_type:complete